MFNCPFKHVKRLEGAIKIVPGEQYNSDAYNRWYKRNMATPNKRKFIHNRFVARLSRLANMKRKSPIATAYHVRNRRFDGIKPVYS